MQRELITGAFLAALALVACKEEQQSPEPSTATAKAEQAWSFRVRPEPAKSDIADRMPTSPSLTMMIPATALFPGATAVIPDVPNPYDSDEQAIAAGERHFAAFNCSGCHAPLGGGGMGPPLSDAEWIYGGSPSQIYLSIVHGRPDGMPAWGAMLPKKTVWELVAYIETLDEIDRPAARKGFDENVGGFRDMENEDGAADAGDTTD